MAFKYLKTFITLIYTYLPTENTLKKGLFFCKTNGQKLKKLFFMAAILIAKHR